MERKDLLKNRQEKLSKKYKELIEQAYNLKQTDHALSDYSEFKAMKLKHKLNKINFLSLDCSRSAS